MKRLGIVVAYDEDGIIYDYLLYFIKELNMVCERLIVAFNGKMQKESRESLFKITEDVYERENRGLDCGAYLDVIENYMSVEEVQTYDEVCVANDTMFGPFISFEKIFAAMEGTEYDVWGTRMNLYPIPHIQSYFFCFRNKTIMEAFTYWKRKEKTIERYENSKSYYVGAMEVGLSRALVEEGYKIGAYTQTTTLDVFGASNLLIRYYNFPFMKKSVNSYKRDRLEILQIYLDAIMCIREKYSYPYDYITSYICSKYGLCIEDALDVGNQLDVGERMNPAILEGFLNAHKNFFLYGAGESGQMMMGIVGEERVRGFILSKREKQYVFGKKVYLLCEIPIDAPIIVAMGRNNTRTVKEKLEPYKNTLYLWLEK